MDHLAMQQLLPTGVLTTWDPGYDKNLYLYYMKIIRFIMWIVGQNRKMTKTNICVRV